MGTSNSPDVLDLQECREMIFAFVAVPTRYPFPYILHHCLWGINSVWATMLRTGWHSMELARGGERGIPLEKFAIGYGGFRHSPGAFAVLLSGL